MATANDILRVQDVIRTSAFLADRTRRQSGDSIEDLQDPSNWEILHIGNDPDGHFKYITDEAEIPAVVYALYKPDEWEDQLGVYFLKDYTYDTHWGDGGENW